MNPYDDNEPDLQRLRRDPEGRRRDSFYGDPQTPPYDAPATPAPHEHRELTLSAGAILGLFFGLVILCGLFFGLGYNMHGRGPAPIAANPAAPTTPATNFSAFKPAAGLAAGSTTASSAGSAAARAATAASALSTSPSGIATPAAMHPPEPAVASPAPIVRGTALPASPAAGPAAGTVAAGAFQVQVAAISLPHRQDAELLLSALRNKGYPAAAHADSDNLIHVQVGPYATRAAADAVRQRLLAEGYSPYIK